MTFLTLIHGKGGSGKSTFANTAPAPRLILDCEGKSMLLKGRKVYWDPAVEKAPEDQPLVVVKITDWDTLVQVFGHLQVNNPFRSCVFDSLTVAQSLLIKKLYGTNAMKIQDYGEILRRMMSLVESFYHQLGFETLTLLAVSVKEEGELRPFFVGKLMAALEYLVVVTGYTHAERSEDGELIQKMLVQPFDGFVAKDNTWCFGTTIEKPNLSDMYDTFTKYIEQQELEIA